MAQLYVLRNQTLKEMQDRIVSNDGELQRYRSRESFEFTPDQLLPFPGAGTAEAPLLEVGNRRTTNDFENARRIYEWIGPLSELEARDERLWAWMAHVPFANYTRDRWPIREGDAQTARNSVLDHWFVRGEGRPSLRRHAIAGLWWAVHLTNAPWAGDPYLAPLRNEDPFFYTRILLGNSEVFFHTLEREFGSSRRILIATLDIVHRSKRTASSTIRSLAKEVNLACRCRELEILPLDELRSFLESLRALDEKAPSRR